MHLACTVVIRRIVMNALLLADGHANLRFCSLFGVSKVRASYEEFVWRAAIAQVVRCHPGFLMKGGFLLVRGGGGETQELGLRARRSQ